METTPIKIKSAIFLAGGILSTILEQESAKAFLVVLSSIFVKAFFRCSESASSPKRTIAALFSSKNFAFSTWSPLVPEPHKGTNTIGFFNTAHSHKEFAPALDNIISAAARTGERNGYSSNKPKQVNQTAQELDDFYNMANVWAESEGE